MAAVTLMSQLLNTPSWKVVLLFQDTVPVVRHFTSKEEATAFWSSLHFTWNAYTTTHELLMKIAEGMIALGSSTWETTRAEIIEPELAKNRDRWDTVLVREIGEAYRGHHLLSIHQYRYVPCETATLAETKHGNWTESCDPM